MYIYGVRSVYKPYVQSMKMYVLLYDKKREGEGVYTTYICHFLRSFLLCLEHNGKASRAEAVEVDEKCITVNDIHILILGML